MRILVIEGALRENGGLRLMMAMADRWIERGEPVQYFVLQKVQEEARVNFAAPPIYGQPKVGRLRYALPLVFLRLLIAVHRADVVVAASETGLGLLLGKAAAMLLRRPFVVVVQADLAQSVSAWVPSRLQRLTLAVHRRVDAAVCVGEGLRGSVLGNGLPDRRAHVIANGVDVDAIIRLAAAPSPVAIERPAVVGVGRLHRQKGFDLLIRAHAELQRRGRKSSLIIVGEGPEREALEGLILREGVADSVSLPGFLANPHALVARCDLFCLPSRFEGFPLVLLEALAAGVPIIAADCRFGPSEILGAGRYGDLVPVESSDALLARMDRFLLDPREMRERSTAGPGRARDFDPEHAASRYLEVFRQLLAQREPTT